MSNEIIEELKGMGSPLAEMPRRMPYSVPEGYFDQLPENVLNIAGKSELFTELPRYAMPHYVPEGYFDTLPANLLKMAKAQDAIVKELTPAKKIAFHPQLKWAAAAIVTLMITLGGYVMFSGAAGNGPGRMLSSVPGKDINEYIQHSYGIDPAKVMQNKEMSELKVDNKEIVAYLDETGWD